MSSVLTFALLLSLTGAEPATDENLLVDLFPDTDHHLVDALRSPVPGAGGDTSALFAQSCLLAGGGAALLVGSMIALVVTITSGDDEAFVPVLVLSVVGIVAGAIMMPLGFQGMALFGGGGDAPPPVRLLARPAEPKRDAPQRVPALFSYAFSY